MGKAMSVEIVELTPRNIPELGLFCISNPRHEGYQAKLKWLTARFREGLKLSVKQAYGSDWNNKGTRDWDLR